MFWKQGDICEECDGPELGVRKEEGGARHSSRSILVSGRGGWWTRGTGEGFARAWDSGGVAGSHKRVDSGLPGQVSPLLLPDLASLTFCQKEVWGARTGEEKGLTSRQNDRMKAERSAQVTSSQGELRLSKLGGRELVPGGKSTLRWLGRTPGRAASEGDTGGRRNPPSARASQARVTQDEMGTQDTAGSPSRHHFPPTVIHLAEGTGAAPPGPPGPSGASRAGERDRRRSARGDPQQGTTWRRRRPQVLGSREISAARRLPWAQPEDAPLPRGTAARRPCGGGAVDLATPSALAAQPPGLG